MDIFTLRIYMYNIIDGIVGKKLGFVLQKKGTNFIHLEEALRIMVLCGGRELRRQREIINKMMCIAVLLGGVI